MNAHGTECEETYVQTGGADMIIPRGRGMYCGLTII